MVNEFQLGLYAYDNLYNADNVASPVANTIKAGLGITANVTNALANNIEFLWAFVNMRDYAEVTADKEGKTCWW